MGYNVIGMQVINNIKFRIQDARCKGFTLIEMLVAIGLMAVVSAVAMSMIGPGPRQSSRDSRKRADLESIRSALEMYRNDIGYYPSAAGCANASCLAPTYIQAVPTPPTGGNYGYGTAGTCGAGACTYTLTASIEKTTDPDYPTLTVTNP